MDTLDLELFRLLPTAPVAHTKKQTGARQTGKFIRGPIPMTWVTRVASLPGKAPLLIGMMLFHLAGLRGTRERLPLCSKRMREFGILNVQTVRNALNAMQSAGLVKIESQPGRCRLITILDYEVGANVIDNHKVG